MRNNIYGKEIIELLKNQGIQLEQKLENTIDLLAFEMFEKGKEEGIKEGIRIGTNKVCNELEIKINSMKIKLD